MGALTTARKDRAGWSDPKVMSLLALEELVQSAATERQVRVQIPWQVGTRPVSLTVMAPKEWKQS